jgi:hypothetical protein
MGLNGFQCFTHAVARWCLGDGIFHGFGQSRRHFATAHIEIRRAFNAGVHWRVAGRRFAEQRPGVVETFQPGMILRTDAF